MMNERPTRRTGDPRQNAEAAFKKMTTKPVEPVAAAPQSVPPGREMVSLRLDRAVLEHFQAAGPGWQDRINVVLRAAAGL